GVLALGPLLGLAGCGHAPPSPPLFELLPPERTGVDFVNHLPEDTAFNIITYLNYYNGGGVAAGDVDGDGLPDLYFTSNLGPNRLYRNLGDYRFEDVTERAGVAGPPGWTTGVTMADVNGDGHLDLYVSSVNQAPLRGRNALYVNDGDGTFTDRTDEYGLGHVGYSTQAAFFDYDGDGDLDLYLLNHSTHALRGSVWNPQRTVRHPEAGDRLFRNDGGRFTDVSEAAGIYGGVGGYGLGVVVSDFDLDGCPDIFVANDFDENDFLYRNHCDGTFTESVARALGHTSRSSMGADAADFNNDGRPDLVVLDMLPEREDILKTSANAEPFTVEQMKLQAGYHPQYARNTLQLNRGRGRFSEIGYLAGVYATDWSWAPLFADLDGDGWKDLFVTNGIYRRPNDLDYIAYVSQPSVQASLARGITRENLSPILARMPQVPLANYAYRNNGDLTFTDRARAWGLAQPGFSTGAVYVDLNHSGALDLVVNNINAPAGIYRNRAREVTGHHYLSVLLRGTGANTAGIGARVVIRYGGRLQMLEQMPTRGFQSSVEPRLHFGLGTALRVDTLTVIWPDRRYQVLTDLAVDQTLTLFQQEARGRHVRGGAGAPLFVDVTAELGLDFRHRENTFFDYNREPLMPHQLSTEGPALAVGDVNGDGLDDVYVGGAKWQAGALYLQTRDGRFRPGANAAFRQDSLAEDVDAAFFDADRDGDLDLYVVSAGNEFWGEAEALRDRLYRNDGRGRFERDRGALPDFFENGSCVVPGDFDADGDLDLFVGSRVVSRRYGATPRSYLLENDGTGRFRDATPERAPALAEAGMVSAASWTDYDADGALDLIVVGEWMPVRVFRQEGRRLVERTAEAGLSGTNGWWTAVAAADVDGDGREDLLLGNLGLNSYLRASPTEPARLYLHDFARNGGLQQILTFYKHGTSYPLAGRDELAAAIPALRDRYRSYAQFGASRVEDLFSRSELARARVLEAYTFASAVARNRGDGTFALATFPTEAQFAPVYAILPHDFDGDGRTDLLLGGNHYGVPPVRGRYDASYGLLLRGGEGGRFQPVDLEAANLMIDGQVRGLARLRRAGGGTLVVVARNGERVMVLRPLRGRDPRLLTQLEDVRLERGQAGQGHVAPDSPVRAHP
ncbi:MAG TPA: VCBS repeat-containing protein, partial [Gemmatimonadales bacterium]|nr:VCBS repeat-containing protein [Gemmatimonadales bacterium]